MPTGAEAHGRVRSAFGEILERFSAAYAATPLLVLSDLAAESSIAAAEEALGRGLQVLACLNVPADEFERRLDGDAATQFRGVISRCRDVIVTRHTATFLAYYSTILVAVWDGVPAHSSGTAEIVGLRENGVRIVGSETLASYMPDVGPVFQMNPANDCCLTELYPAAVGLDLLPKKKAQRRKPVTPEQTARSEFETALRNLNRFNDDIAQEPEPQSADALQRFHARADGASNRLQQWTLHSLTGLYVVAAIAGGAQLVFEPPLTTLWRSAGAIGTALRIIVLVAAFLWLKLAKREDYENRYQDYRAIAEALRVQRAWCCAGMRDQLVESSYLQMQQSELRWIRLALRNIYLECGAWKTAPEDSLQSSVCGDWLVDQRSYYERKAPAQQRSLRDLARVGGALAAIGGAISAAALLGTVLVHGVNPMPLLHFPPHTWKLYEEWPNLGRYVPQKILQAWLVYLMTVPAALAGMLALLLGFYTQQRGFSENARRYQRMFTVFDAAQRRLQGASGSAQDVLAEVGHEALSEHADWLILHRERPLRFVNAPLAVQGGSSQ